MFAQLALRGISGLFVAVALLALGPAAAAPGDDVADRVFGQGGDFTSNTCNLDGISASSRCLRAAAAVDAAGDRYLADADPNNSRVLEYSTPLTTDRVADRVFGQEGSFTSSGCNNGG